MADILNLLSKAIQELDQELEAMEFENLLDGEVRHCEVCGKLLGEDEGIKLGACLV